MSRWDVAVIDKVPDGLKDTLALAVGLKTYKAYRELIDSDRWQRLEELRRPDAAAPLGEHRHEGSRGSRRPLPELSGCALHDQHDPRGDAQGVLRPRPRGKPMPTDGGDADETLAAHAAAGVDVDALAAKLQRTRRRASSSPGTTSCRSSTSRARRSRVSREERR